MGCPESKSARVEPEYTCKISPDSIDDSSKGIYLGKITNHHITLAENCIEGDKKNKQLQELRGIKGKIVACGFLHDGTAVLADEVRKILLLVQKNKEACNFLLLKSDPIDIAVLGIDIFVTLSDKKIEHATVVNDKLFHQSTFKTSQPCLGIASFNGDIAVGFKNGDIHILDRKFQKHGDFVLPKFEDGRVISPTSMTQFRQTLLVTDYFAHAVVRVTMNGEPLFVYAGMTSPRCTVVDNFGNIVLAGYDDLTGEKIQHLSARGEKIPSRMATADFVQFPYCAAFYRKYSKLIVAGESDRCESCTLRILDDTSVSLEVEEEIDNASDIISTATTLTFIENSHGKTDRRLPNTIVENIPNTVDESTSIMEFDSMPDTDDAKTQANENPRKDNNVKTPETNIEKTPSGITDKSLVAKDTNQTATTTSSATTTEDTETLVENTALTVFDKTQKGVVKKVLITVREKPPEKDAQKEQTKALDIVPNSGDEKIPIIVTESKNATPSKNRKPSIQQYEPTVASKRQTRSDEKIPVADKENKKPVSIPRSQTPEKSSGKISNTQDSIHNSTDEKVHMNVVEIKNSSPSTNKSSTIQKEQNTSLNADEKMRITDNENQKPKSQTPEKAPGKMAIANKSSTIQKEQNASLNADEKMRITDNENQKPKSQTAEKAPGKMAIAIHETKQLVNGDAKQASPTSSPKPAGPVSVTNFE